MSATQLISDLEARNVRISAAFGMLHIDAPKGTIKPQTLKDLRQRKSEIMDILSDKSREGGPLTPRYSSQQRNTPDVKWDGFTREIIDWFLETAPPSEPFELSPGVTIADPSRWWAAIRSDIFAGPHGPRARYGAVQGDLRRLAGLFASDIIEREERAAIMAEGACRDDETAPSGKELNDLPHDKSNNRFPWDC
jgi:hypothetical protein